MFIKTTFKESIKVKRITNYVWKCKMQPISLFPEITKLADFRWKNADVSRTHEGNQVIYIFSGSSLGKISLCHCRIVEYMWQILESGHSYPRPPYFAPARPVLNRIKDPTKTCCKYEYVATIDSKSKSLQGLIAIQIRNAWWWRSNVPFPSWLIFHYLKGFIIFSF